MEEKKTALPTTVWRTELGAGLWQMAGFNHHGRTGCTTKVLPCVTCTFYVARAYKSPFHKVPRPGPPCQVTQPFQDRGSAPRHLTAPQPKRSFRGDSLQGGVNYDTSDSCMHA